LKRLGGKQEPRKSQGEVYGASRRKVIYRDGRISHTRKDCSVTTLIEKLAGSVERRVTAKLSGKAQVYYGSE
jgi:hypothetical protein